MQLLLALAKIAFIVCSFLTAAYSIRILIQFPDREASEKKNIKLYDSAIFSAYTDVLLSIVFYFLFYSGIDDINNSATATSVSLVCSILYGILIAFLDSRANDRYTKLFGDSMPGPRIHICFLFAFPKFFFLLLVTSSFSL